MSATGLSIHERSLNQPERTPLRLLLIEDNPDDAFLLARHLGKNGFAAEIRRVETAGEMLLALSEMPLPQIVLADYHLPNFSGPAALQILKRSALDIPLIMLSGAMSETTAVESMRAGAQDYVTKQNLSRLVPAVERELKEAEDRGKKLAAELALQASEDRFHRLVEAMPLSLLISDASGAIVYTNNAANRLFELPGNSAGTHLDQLCPDLKLDAVFTVNQPALEPFEAICLTASGHPVSVLVGVAILNPDAAPPQRQLAAFLADLSMQKKSEELLRRTEKLAVAGRLAASIAHEINNPLQAVTNLLYLIDSSPLQSTAKDHLEQATHELSRIAQIAVQTLRFHRQSTHRTETDLSEIMEAVISLFASRLCLLQVTVDRRFRPAPKAHVYDGEIRQVVANLVSNAIDALGERGRLFLRICPAHHPRTGRPGVVLTVADTGHGMSPETVARIFEPFFSTRDATGTGLGLWISLEIVEKHGGTLRVRSRERTRRHPGGTVFRFFIPNEAVSPVK